MKNHPLRKFSFYSICALVLAGLFILSSVSADAQIYRSRSSRKKGRGGKIEFKRNIVWLEGLGSSQVIGPKYERILMFGSVVSVRPDVGITPFMLDEKYNFIAGRSITPITGLGIYFHIMHTPIRIGAGASVLHDIFFQGIPESAHDSVGPNPNLSYRVRIMPYAVIEATIKERYCIRAGYTPIIDPANDYQTQMYVTHWATIGFGYKFGR